MSISWEKEEEEEQEQEALYEIPCRSEQLLQPQQQLQLQPQSKKKIKQVACSIGGDVPPSIQRRFLELPRDEDRALIADFIIDCYNHHNITPSTKQVYIANLVYLSRYFQHKKSFSDMS
jgi:hypothetical protein